MDDEVDGPPPLAPVNEADNQLNDADDAVTDGQLLWENTPPNQAIEELKQCYEKIVFWCKKLFMLPKGSSGKDYIKEIIKMISEWLIESSIMECATFTLHVMLTLLLQNPSKSSKSKDHVITLKQRLGKWKNGEFLQLLREARAFQNRLP